MEKKKRNWSYVPHAPRVALSRSDMSFKEWGVYTAVVASIDFRTEEYVTSLPGLAADLQWTNTPDDLRKTVRNIEHKGLIACETRTGPGATWIIRLGPKHHAALELGVIPATIPAGEGPAAAGIIPAEGMNGKLSTLVLIPGLGSENSSPHARAKDEDEDIEEEEDVDEEVVVKSNRSKSLRGVPR